MQTQISQQYRTRADGREAERILRSCVHCGFCNATCPTYQLTGDELDGPRGRIYLIKLMLEGQSVSNKTRLHLDRCLSCRACETTCPSGVEYHRLLDIGREILDERLERPIYERWTRRLLAGLLSRRRLFSFLLAFGQRLRPVLPRLLRQKIPPVQNKKEYLVDDPSYTRTVLLLEGCVQDALAPNINRATRFVMAKFGIQCQFVSKAVCCGAVNFHLDDVAQARQQAKANIDAWWPFIEQQQVEAIIVNASGCGLFTKDYATLLKEDADYLEKAIRVAELTKDPAEFLRDESWEETVDFNVEQGRHRKVAFHSPCTLQHGQRLNGVVESILQRLGVELLLFPDAHLCCGSAGTYALTQPLMSGELRRRKLEALGSVQPELIVTANVGCQSHLSAGTAIPVRHWLELVAEMLTKTRTET